MVGGGRIDINNCMTFILVLIMVLSTGEISTSEVNRFETMNDCFAARDVVVERLGRPINYQSVCVLYNPDK